MSSKGLRKFEFNSMLKGVVVGKLSLR